MERRKVLQYLPVAFAVTASPGQLLDIAQRVRASGYASVSAPQELLIALVDRILPATTTPSASQAGVPAFIQLFLDEVASPQDRGLFYDALDQFAAECRKGTGVVFEDLSEAAQNQYLVELFERRDHFCMELKKLTLTAFFTSQRGMTEALDYNPIPGTYRPCVPVNPETKTEASYF